jgi:hypothetical protein
MHFKSCLLGKLDDSLDTKRATGLATPQSL